MACPENDSSIFWEELHIVNSKYYAKIIGHASIKLFLTGL